MDTLKEIIFKDYYRNTGVEATKMRLLKLFLHRKNNPMKFIVCYRLAQHYQNASVLKYVTRFLYRHYAEKYNYEIPLGAAIGYGLRLPHWAGGIVMHANAIIGNNCEIMQGVTIGNNIMKSRSDVAVIGDRVTIAAGAKVIGKVVIGDDVFIGANAVVNRDIPSNSIAGGIPAKILKSNVTPVIVNEI